MNEDIQKLRAFLTAVYDWLERSYNTDAPGSGARDAWPSIPVDRDFADVALAAWNEFKEAHPLRSFLDKVSPDLADGDRQALLATLSDHGLTGAQLAYKLHLVEHAAANARAGMFGWKRRLIDLIDIIIGSLSPTGIAGALKELKDALVGSLPAKD